MSKTLEAEPSRRDEPNSQRKSYWGALRRSFEFLLPTVAIEQAGSLLDIDSSKVRDGGICDVDVTTNSPSATV